MLGRHPELFKLFSKTNQRTGRQPHALAEAVLAFATHIENLAVLGPAVERMCTKHCALQVLPEHYTIVHDNLMEAIGEVLGAAVTPEVGAGWSEAVMALAGILIDREAALYDAAAARAGGWRGWKEFEVADITQHVGGVSTFTLKAKDGSAQGIEFTPGQYLTVDVGATDADGDFIAPRHYTITSAPGSEFLQCTVKALEKGAVSNAMHALKIGDSVNLSPPFGDYVVEDSTAPAVMLSAGIGVTPMYALHAHGKLNAKAAIHVDHTLEHNPFHEYFTANVPNFRAVSTQTDGHPSVKDLVAELAAAAGDLSSTSVYLCGPVGFMTEAERELHALNPDVKVLHENFGPRTEENYDAAQQKEAAAAAAAVQETRA